MRICLISYEFLPDTGGGGAGALYTDLATALSKGGHEVTVIAGNVRNQVEIEDRKNLRIVRVGSRHSVGPHGNLLLRALQVARTFKSERLRCDFDIVESPEIRAEAIVANLANRSVPFVTRLVTPRFVVAEVNDFPQDPIVNMLEKRSAQLSRTLISDSEQWGKEIVRRWSISEERLMQCPLGIDLSRVDEVMEVKIPVDPPYVLYSGKMTLAKGPQVLAQAAPEILDAHPDTKIVFAGVDSFDRYGRSIRDLIMTSTPKKYLKSLIFLGHITSWSLLVSLYRNASVCVKADSRGNHSYDAFGQMACARPMVCSRTEGFSDMIAEGWNGYLFDRLQPSDLANRVSILLGDRQLSMTIGRRARETMETRFSASRFATETVTIYEGLLTSQCESAF